MKDAPPPEHGTISVETQKESVQSAYSFPSREYDAAFVMVDPGKVTLMHHPVPLPEKTIFATCLHWTQVELHPGFPLPGVGVPSRKLYETP